MPNDMTPTRGYAFKDFSRREPTKPLPGDRLDTELDRILTALRAQTEYFTRAINPDGTIRGKIIGEESIKEGVLAQWADQIRKDLRPSTEKVETAEKNTQNWLTQAKNHAQEALTYLQETRQLASDAQTVRELGKTAAKDAAGSRSRAESAASTTQIRAQDAATSASSARISEDMAYRWAEKTDGPVYVPSGGDPVNDGFYSAKHWAVLNQSYYEDIQNWYADIALWYPDMKFYWEDFRSTYYGPLPSDPATDPLGNPPTEGDLYFNTTTNAMRAYDGVNWVGFDGETTFLALSDTPGVYTGSELQYARVNAGATALEFFDLDPTFTAINDAIQANTDKNTEQDGRLGALEGVQGDYLSKISLTRQTVAGAVDWEALQRFGDILRINDPSLGDGALAPLVLNTNVDNDQAWMRFQNRISPSADYGDIRYNTNDDTMAVVVRKDDIFSVFWRFPGQARDQAVPPVGNDVVMRRQWVDYLDALRMRWRHPYSLGPTYEANDMVRDGDWLMVANKQTLERAAPQPQDEAWASESVGTLNFISQAPAAQPVWLVGNTFAPDGGAYRTNGVRYQVPDITGNFTYELWAVLNINTPEQAVLQLIGPHVPSRANEWITANFGGEWVLEGSTASMVLLARATVQPDTFSSTWDVKWDNSNPSTGEANFYSSGTELRVANEDKNGVNQYTQLQQIEAGGTITFGGSTWTITSISNSGGTGGGGRHIFELTPSQGRPDEGEYVLQWAWGSTLPIPYSRDNNFYSGATFATGFEGADLAGATTTPHGYPVDLFAAEYVPPDDWDVAGYVGLTGGGGGGGGPGDGPDYASTSGPVFPEFPEPNDIHYMTQEPVGLYLYYDDGNSRQWVQTN